MKSAITIENYEAFLLDYFEGNLSVDTANELKSFLVQHPELEIDLNDLDLPSLEENNLNFENSNKLKKEFSANEELVLNYLEGNLNANEIKLFEKELKQNENINILLNQYQKTILPIESEIIFENKAELKRETKIILWWNYQRSAAIAAGLLLAIGFYFYFISRQNIDSTTHLATNKLPIIASPKKIFENKQTNLDSAKSNKKLIVYQKPNFINQKRTAEIVDSIKPEGNEMVNIPKENFKNELPIDSLKPLEKIVTTTETLIKKSEIKIDSLATTEKYVVNEVADERENEEESPSLSPTPPSAWERFANALLKAKEFGLKSVQVVKNENHSILIATKNFGIEKK